MSVADEQHVQRYLLINTSPSQVALITRRLTLLPLGIKEARKCVSDSMKLTYRPDLANQNRPKMCPDGFCGECLGQCPSHVAIKYQIKRGSTNAMTAPANVPCAPGDSSGPCNPYSHFVDIPGGRKGVKWRQTCDEFPFGELGLVAPSNY